MKVSDIFYVKYGVDLELINCEIADEDDLDCVNFVSRTAENNGVSARVKLIDGIEPQAAGTISCAAGGSVLSTFLQEKPYYSGRDLFVLTPKYEMTKKEKLFWCTAIKFNAYKYNYGRQANKTLADIVLPDSIPKWVDNVDIKTITTVNKSSNKKIDTSSWKYFKIENLFDVTGSSTTPLTKLQEIGKGNYPYVTTQAKNNGIAGYYDYYTEKGNVLTVDSAVLGFCTYQEKSFSASDHVELLIPKFKMNKYIGLFFVTIINKENFRYNYGIKFNQGKIKKTKIKLPITSDGNVDFNYIETFVKRLPFADRI